MNAAAFGEGQLVQLKSGGPIMTVVTTNIGGVNCTWFDDKDKLQNNTFPAHVLKPYEDEGPPTMQSEHELDD